MIVHDFSDHFRKVRNPIGKATVAAIVSKTCKAAVVAALLKAYRLRVVIPVLVNRIILGLVE